MIVRLLLFCILVALWWAALWFDLPVDHDTHASVVILRNLSQLSLPALVMLHVLPPPMAVLVWFLCKRLWAWRKNRAKQAADKAGADQKQAARKEAAAQRQQVLERRRASLECRGEWAVVPKKPEWCEAEAVIMEQDAESVQENGREAATRNALEQIFGAAFGQCAAIAWLPVLVVPGGDAESTQLETLNQPWHQAVKAWDIENAPLQPDCKFLSGSGEIIDRVIAQFENDPGLPALILLGMDAPSSGASGHAVAAVLLSRPGLSVEAEAASRALNPDNPYTPYWERNRISIKSQWGRIPVPLQPLFLQDTQPLASLHRSCSLSGLAFERAAALKKQFQEILGEALINAALREPLPEEDEDGKPEQSSAGEAAPLELGWVVHDNGDVTGLTALTYALSCFDCEISLTSGADDLMTEHGDVGTSRGVLMLAEALIRVRQLQKPVLVVGFDETDEIGVGVIRPLG
ncbi:MAG: hypothetical protein LBU45_00840 [Azoarcus sp.]|jgi:hypothetical protein|nr:hypothetical protein [Azoarcus sp.]